MRVTGGAIVGLVAAGRTSEEILAAYLYLEGDDISEALTYAAWRAREVGIVLVQKDLEIGLTKSRIFPYNDSVMRKEPLLFLFTFLIAALGGGLGAFFVTQRNQNTATPPR